MSTFKLVRKSATSNGRFCLKFVGTVNRGFGHDTTTLYAYVSETEMEVDDEIDIQVNGNEAVVAGEFTMSIEKREWETEDEETGEVKVITTKWLR